MRLHYNDGGRQAAGFRGTTSDCVVRAVAIATGLPYQQIYDRINEIAQDERPRRNKKTGKRHARSSSASGVYNYSLDRLMKELGWIWTPTMGIGTGCRVHLRDGELPPGRLVVAVPKHLTAVIDGVIHDTHDPSRNGTRCVYGYYWRRP